MTQANTDYLLPIPSPVSDRAFGASPIEERASNFGDHLNQARTFSGDDLFPRGSSSQRAETSRYDRDERKWNNHAPKPYDSGNRSISPPPTSDQPIEETVKAKPAADESKSETDKSEEADQTAAAEAAGACQSAKANPSKTADSKAESETPPDKLAKLEVAATAKKAAITTTDRKANANSDSAAKGSTPEGEVKLAVSQAELAATDENVWATGEDVEQAQVAVDDEKAKAAKDTASTAKPAKDKPVGKGEAEPNAASGANAGEKQTSSDTTQTIKQEAASTSTESTAKSKAKPGSEESPDDEPRTATRNKQPAPSAKVDASQLVGAATIVAETDMSESLKEKGSERAAKPVTVKAEPITEAFARITRNSATGSNDSAGNANESPAVDPARFLGRVTKAFQTAQERGGKLHLRLSPPELGALRIELNIKDGVMSASLQAENSDARRLLLEHLPALRDRLAEQNIRVDRFDVDVQRDGSEGQTDTRGSQQQQFHQSFDEPTPRRQATPQQRLGSTEPQTTEPTTGSDQINDAGLNLVV